MSWMASLLSGGAGELIKTVGDTVDKFVTTDKEKMELQNSLKKAEQDYRVEMKKLELKGIEIGKELVGIEESNVSDRWKADMASDNWLSKNARPLVLLVFTVLIVIMAVGDRWLQVDDAMTSMVQNIALLLYGAYFGGRSWEKIQTISKKK